MEFLNDYSNRETKNLKEIIYKKLFPLVNNNYIFLDLPYYTNIGDVLIWKGTDEFLEKLSYKCLYRSAIETYIPPKISKDVIILLQGGGNFGDIWRRHNEFRLKIINNFPKNKIIILSQTAFYENKNVMKRDVQSMANHPNLTICARDYMTYQLLTKYFFRNNILLVPDMSFFISKKSLKDIGTEKDKALFLKREDKELKVFEYEKYLRNKSGLEEHDWPTMEKSFLINKILSCLKKVCSRVRFKNINLIINKIIDWYAIKIYMPILVKIGIKFLNGYRNIYTTRLHGAILAILLGKEKIFIFDNFYGKNKSFYETWLSKINNVHFIE